MTAKIALRAILIGLAGLGSHAVGAVTGTTGAVRVIATPSNLRLGFTENNVRIRAFSEQLDATLANDLPVDLSVPSSVPDGPLINLTPGVIPAGTRVESWLLHFDPIGIPDAPLMLQGSISFDTPVLGIEVLSASLDGTDMILGAAGSEYSFNETLRGLELAVGMAGINTFDGIALSSDRKTIVTILSTQNSFDQVRIITAVAVPEPSTSALGGAGCVCLVACLTGRRLVRRHGVSRSMLLRAACLSALCMCAIATTATTARAGFSFAHHGSADPVSEGFTGGTVFGAPSTVGPIANDLGSPAWSIAGMAQSSQYGYSSGPLTASQLTDVATHGFTLTIEARAVQAINPTYDATHPVGIVGGSLYTGVQRFDIYLGLNASGDTVVFLPTAVDAVGPGSSLVGVGPNFTLTGQGSSYHTYSLVYDPGTQLADLFVDGVSRIQGYAGNTTFNTTNAGLVFGGASGGQANFRLATVQSVPEPTSAALLGAGGVALAALVYRRRRAVRNR